MSVLDPTHVRALDEIERAASLMSNGGLVAFPTETVYGLGASARDTGALRRIFTVKGRPPDHPLIVHIAASHQLLAWASYIPDAARRLADAFWPGPLTLILPKAPGVPDEVTGGASTVGLRVENPQGTPAPGQKPSHYAPKARVVLAAAEQAEATAARLAAQGCRVGHLAVAPSHHPGVWWLPLSLTLDQQAANLYQRLHEADALQLDMVVASLPRGHGIAEAIADRLSRAAGRGDWH